MAEDLVFPRLVYRGAPDTLGIGPHTHPETGELVGETKRCETADAFEGDRKDGWRLTRELPDAKKAAAEKAAADKQATDDAKKAADDAKAKK